MREEHLGGDRVRPGCLAQQETAHATETFLLLICNFCYLSAFLYPFRLIILRYDLQSSQKNLLKRF